MSSALTTIHDTGRRLLRFGPRRVDHIPAMRIALGLAIPMAVLLLIDRVDWAMFVGFGAFTGIYSRYEPTRMRFRRQSMAGAMLTLCVTVGAALAQLGQRLGTASESWTTLLVSSVIAGLAATFVLARGLKPGGAIFPLFAVAAVASAPPAAPIWAAFLLAGACASLCVVLGLLGHWAGERHPGEDARAPAEQWTRDQLGAEFVRFTSAAAVAGALGLASGLPFPYWAQIAAIALLSAPGRALQVERGLHRVIGTALGIGTTAFLLSFPTVPWQLVVWVVVLQFLAELYVLRNYAFALLFITPLALLMVQLAHPQPVGPTLRARVLETVIGVVVGLLVVSIAALRDRWDAARDGGTQSAREEPGPYRRPMTEARSTPPPRPGSGPADAPSPAYTHGYGAAVLESHRARTAENSAAHLLPHLRPGMRLLDVGSGAGTITAGLARIVGPAHVTALEVEEEAAALTRAELERQGLAEVEVVVGDAHDLPFAPGSFDVVHAHQVLQHVPDPVRALTEFRRVSGPGGLVAVRDSDYEGFRWWPEPPGIARWLSLYLRAARANGGTPDAGRRLLAWAHAAGFEHVEPGSSTQLYATPEGRRAWAGTVAGRITSAPFGAQLEREGWADEAERERIAAEFRAWAEEPDAWFSLLHGEILARG